MKLDRELQFAILHELSDCYPNSAYIHKIKCNDNTRHFHGNLHYLHQHGLVYKNIEENKHLGEIGATTASITQDGLDFLADDGGLGAILNKITIKLDPEDLEKLVAARLSASGTPEDEQNEIMQAIRNLSVEGIKALNTRLIEWALDNAPNAAHLIQKILFQAT